MPSQMAPAPARPRLLLRAALAAACGVAVAGACAAALREPLGLDAAYPGRVSSVFAAIIAVAVAGLWRAHPYDRLGTANLVTGVRTVVMSLLAGVALAPDAPPSGWAVIAVASVGAGLDVVDGPLARRSGLASRFGARFDMEVDALLILVLSILVWRIVPVGAWVLASGLMRYAFIAAGWVLPWMAADLPPSRRRQAICVLQIVSLIAALSPLVSPGAAAALAGTGLLLLAWSFAVDVGWLATHR